MSNYDVIVVGAGNGGLMAAANTSKAGLKTLLLEKHNLPGGCATSFRRGRFEFEPSLHELCGVGTKEQPDEIFGLFDELGAKVDWRYEDTMYRTIVKGENGYDVTVKAKREPFYDSMEEAVPGCREKVKAFIELNDKVDEALAYVDRKKGNPNPLVMVLKHSDFMRVCAHSTEEILDALEMPDKAKKILTTYWGYLGVPTDELNCMHFLSMLTSYMDNCAAMPYKRSHELSLALCDVIYKNGGEIRYNSEVTEFLYNEDGSIAGVVANGEKLYAKEVVSNVIANNVFTRSKGVKLPERDVKLAKSREFGISVATVYLGLDKSAEELGIKDYTVFIANDGDPRTQDNNRVNDGFYIVNCLNNVIPDSSPEGTCTLFFTTLIYGSDLPKDLKPQDYKKYKNDLAERLILDYEKTMGVNVMDHIEEISVATPVTFARYLGTPDGTIYGYKNAGWDNVIMRTTAQGKDNNVKGLSFVGGHGVRGDGYSSAYSTGATQGKVVVKKLKGDK